jgi:predicted RNA-binding protein YlxR (DUF448 family)
VRVVRLGDGSLVAGRMLPGRGAWLCRDSAACVDQAQQRRAFERALRGQVDATAVDCLRQELGLSTGGADRADPESQVS